MGRFKLPREFYIPKGSVKVADKQSDAVAYLYEGQGKFYAMGFHGRADKPDFHFSYRTAEARNKRVAEHFDGRRQALAFKSGRRAERLAWEPDYKVGEILRTCWGYDQTNVEYFEVVEVRGKHVILREIAQHRTDTAYMQGKCAPKPGQYIGEPIRRLAQQHGIKIEGNYRWASRVSFKEVAGVKVYENAHWTAYA